MALPFPKNCLDKQPIGQIGKSMLVLPKDIARFTNS